MVSDSAGYACQISQPRPFDRFMIEFLTKHGLFPGFVNLAEIEA